MAWDGEAVFHAWVCAAGLCSGRCWGQWEALGAAGGAGGSGTCWEQRWVCEPGEGLFWRLTGLTPSSGQQHPLRPMKRNTFPSYLWETQPDSHSRLKTSTQGGGPRLPVPWAREESGQGLCGAHGISGQTLTSLAHLGKAIFSIPSFTTWFCRSTSRCTANQTPFFL